MILYPAIDLYKGKIVRLKQGDFNQRTDYALAPITAAKAFLRAGSSWVHIIDLEGAQAGHPAHLQVIEPLKNLGLMVQYGGGLRSLQNVEEGFRAGANRLYVGSLLAENREIAPELFSLWGDRIIPAVDIKDGKVAVKGWTCTSSSSPLAYLSFLYSAGYRTVLVTSVNRDGTGLGPDLSLYSKLSLEFPGFSIIAAGGISSIKELEDLRALNIAGAVLGKVLYEKDFNLCEALKRVMSC
ncbi:MULTISPECIES: HisA/HisF-related TIM barrel protein [Aminobacterium]|jgi:phosphoribosylformimino-5-aminoimidazole carboxamide ribotide isomerase|uniref:1-(5-phosphoribosyl)-5-[(5-phosphoribosylamino)methylideneamino] imidazole-4-carboxamide isomerase n=1 Tax=Aminobacterium colombiense (strain DSM 12261 / ALA-1) TaxID=572547 RepID=D5EE32_AMICL|nr:MULTISPECIES: 1-(5-phosphoribosyl)-5-[(5-phosphoribosylamino)methylideneamino] imidazole-4-carboxamide isomerase [Aminobacterium]MDD2378668.1 1-(5-phosphoribosyl)-5-[(5-phosphoribosylamino)methylideneamino] imidazole-4-carboxamide isomerase [Aminobacterium colombiense]ADE56814.1 histidine biosynthesis protein [Aminobacterium colombiense DSM 12261]MDD3767685.1 1-(5-phosphoribosyl)-5-[(5-phosphoribosylamino)methylideneamino] imidazole-4-carboxamide isomerase [Aminobacterium colombiense]MDD4264